MSKDEARQYFEDKGLNYDVLTPQTIDLLIAMIQVEIIKLKEEITDCFLLRMRQHKYSAKQRKTGDYSGIELLVDGTYFSKREAITFNADGFIGFSGWGSGYANRPFIDGFIRWCDEVSIER